MKQEKKLKIANIWHFAQSHIDGPIAVWVIGTCVFNCILSLFVVPFDQQTERVKKKGSVSGPKFIHMGACILYLTGPAQQQGDVTVPFFRWVSHNSSAQTWYLLWIYNTFQSDKNSKI